MYKFTNIIRNFINWLLRPVFYVKNVFRRIFSRVYYGTCRLIGRQKPYSFFVKCVAIIISLLVLLLLWLLILTLAILLFLIFPYCVSVLCQVDLRTWSDVFCYLVQPGSYSIPNWNKEITFDNVVGASMVLFLLYYMILFYISWWTDVSYLIFLTGEFSSYFLPVFLSYTGLRFWVFSKNTIIPITFEDTICILLVQGFLLLKEFFYFFIHSWKFFSLLFFLFLLLCRLNYLIYSVLCLRNKRLGINSWMPKSPFKVLLNYIYYIWDRRVYLTFDEYFSLKFYFKIFTFLFLVFVYSLYSWSIYVPIFFVSSVVLFYEFKYDKEKHLEFLNSNDYFDDDNP